MKHTLIALTCLLSFTSYTFGMNKKQITCPEEFNYEVKKHILLDLAFNMDQYFNRDFYAGSTNITSIVNISYVNQDLYEALKDVRNCPLFTRTMAKKIRQFDKTLAAADILYAFKTPGGKKCLKASKQLYDKKLNEETIEKLYKEGAFLNYTAIDHSLSVINYWFNKTTPQATKNLAKILSLHNEPKDIYLHHNTSSDSFEVLLTYMTTHSMAIPWQNILPFCHPERMNFICNTVSQEELTNGLIHMCSSHHCIDQNYENHIQQLIDKGANPNTALENLTLKMKDHYSLTFDTKYGKVLAILLKNKAFNGTALKDLQTLHSSIGHLIDMLEENEQTKDQEDLFIFQEKF